MRQRENIILHLGALAIEDIIQGLFFLIRKYSYTHFPIKMLELNGNLFEKCFSIDTFFSELLNR